MRRRGVTQDRHRFNTQPPEGGWYSKHHGHYVAACFNTQPPEGGWVLFLYFSFAAVSFNTQPPEGGW